MVEDTKEITLMIRKRVMVFSIGLMAESTKEDGKTENNMVLVPTPLQVEKLSKESGKMERDFTGFKTNNE